MRQQCFAETHRDLVTAGWWRSNIGVRPSIARDFTVATVAPPNTQQTEAEIAAIPAPPTEVEVITAKETKDKEKEAKEGVEEPKKGKA